MAFTHSRVGSQDGNHAELVSCYESLGCTFLDLHKVGFGCPDGLVGCVGLNDLVEFKVGEAGLDAKQARFIRDWRGKVFIVRSQDEVIAHVAHMRRRLR